MNVFKTAGFNRSPTPPLLIITCHKHLAFSGLLMQIPFDRHGGLGLFHDLSAV